MRETYIVIFDYNRCGKFYSLKDAEEYQEELISDGENRKDIKIYKAVVVKEFENPELLK